jgi:hypothetical protein
MFVTDLGRVFGCGSNRFGQLGTSESDAANVTKPEVFFCFLLLFFTLSFSFLGSDVVLPGVSSADFRRGLWCSSHSHPHR